MNFEMENNKLEFSDLFNSYEQDYKASLIILKDFLKRVKDHKINDITISNMQSMKSELQKSDSCLKQMEIELNSFPTQFRKKLGFKIKGYRTEFQEIRKQFFLCEDSFNLFQSKNQLFDERKENSKNDKKSNRDKLLETDKQINSQKNNLFEANRLAYDTEKIVINVQNELKKNSETINSSIKTSKTIYSDLKTSDKILLQMRRKIITNKLILVFIIIFLALIILLLLYVKLRHLITF